jgi:hypothetical protein
MLMHRAVNFSGYILGQPIPSLIILVAKDSRASLEHLLSNHNLVRFVAPACHGGFLDVGSCYVNRIIPDVFARAVRKFADRKLLPE